MGHAPWGYGDEACGAHALHGGAWCTVSPDVCGAGGSTRDPRRGELEMLCCNPPPQLRQQEITCRTVWAALSWDPNRVRARVHTVRPLTAHRTVCLKEEELHPDPTCNLGPASLPCSRLPAPPLPRKGRVVHWPRLGPKGTMMPLGVAVPPQRGPATGERGCEPSTRASLCMERAGQSGALVSVASCPSLVAAKAQHRPIQILLSAFPWNPRSPQTYGVQ